MAPAFPRACTPSGHMPMFQGFDGSTDGCYRGRDRTLRARISRHNSGCRYNERRPDRGAQSDIARRRLCLGRRDASPDPGAAGSAKSARAGRRWIVPLLDSDLSGAWRPRDGWVRRSPPRASVGLCVAASLAIETSCVTCAGLVRERLATSRRREDCRRSYMSRSPRVCESSRELYLQRCLSLT